MSIKFVVQPNRLQNNGTFMPRVIDQPVMSYRRILSEIEESTTMRSHDAELAIQRLLLSLIKYVSDGYKVETPFGVFRATVHGTFQNETEDFYPGLSTNNHCIEVSYRPDRDFVQKISESTNTERITDFSLKHPRVFSITNISRSDAQDIQAAEIISLNGVNLKTDPEAEDEGIFWLAADGTSIKTDFLIENRNVNVKLMVPSLAPGSYSLSIATRLGNHKLRSSLYDEEIIVIA